MLFMVIETYKNQDAVAIYQRATEKGRLLPEGLRYIDSWVEVNFNRCFQLMACDDLTLFQQWIIQWRDLVEFEIVPVVASVDATKTVNKFISH